MNLDEFLKLPKKKVQPNDRIRKTITKLKEKVAGKKTPLFCTKKTYTKKIAKGKVKRSVDKPIKLTNYYYCDKCKGWHVTSKDDKEYWREKKQ
jgi:hypothetical protein